MTTYVLVHGAWHGGWAWQDVARPLRNAGHVVYCPTLTGLGERAHLASPDVGLDTHVLDVVNVLRYEELCDVVLVGHSYAGMVVTGAAAAAADRVDHLVVVDGFLPRAGEQAIELLPEHAAQHYRESSRTEQGGGWRIPPRPLANLGVRDPDRYEHVVRRLVPHPLKTYTDAAPAGVDDLRVPGTFLLCDGWNTPFREMAARAEQLGWEVAGLPCDHEVLVTDPDRLTKSLAATAQGV